MKQSILAAMVAPPCLKWSSKSTVFGIALLTAIGFAAPVKAENPEHVRQLLETKRCPGCDLTGANLANIDLSEADLTGADLSGANLSGQF
jgi:uncharacterized protein YjbI with pentapeptide repeats